MRPADTIVGVIRERGRRRLPVERLDRHLYNQDLCRHADGRLYRQAAALPPGATPDTVDGMSLAKLEASIEALRQEPYQWTPVRRTDIPKPSGKLRPLGLPTWSDKRLHEGLRLVLEADDEPPCRPHAPGFRPGRGGHPALGEMTKSWRGVKWFSAGDISQGFERLDHEGMRSILRARLHEHRFLRRLSNLLKAGDVEDWRVNATLSGSPHGGVVRPLLSHLSLDRLEQVVAPVRLPASHRGDRRRPSPPSMALLQAARNTRRAGVRDEAKRRRRPAQPMPSRDPHDPPFRRLWYVRYADDWLLGCSGPREEAEAIKGQLHACWRDTLTLKLSEEKPLMTTARTQAAPFLGDDVVHQHADDQPGHARHRRGLNGGPGVQRPEAGMRAKCATDLRRGKACQRAACISEADARLITQSQAAYRGFVQDDGLASKAHRLGRGQRGMELALVYTLADQYRTSAGEICRHDKMPVQTAHGTRPVLEARHARGGGKAPRVARCGGSALRWRQQALLNDAPTQVYGHRREVVPRLLAQACERCGATEHGDGHHVRKLADLSRPGQRENPLWGPTQGRAAA